MFEEKSKSGYTPYFSKSPVDSKFTTDFESTLVDDMQVATELLNSLRGKTIAWDTETVGLDFDAPDFLVGVSISDNPYKGYYFPIGHKLGRNLPKKEFLELFNSVLLESKSLLYNAPFDLITLWVSGVEDWNKYRIFDVMNLVYNSDTSWKTNGLKAASAWYLGRTPPTFEETVGNVKDMNFSDLSPQEGHYYASCDAANTFALYNKLIGPMVKESKNILAIDNSLSKIMPYILTNKVKFDNESMKFLESQVTKRISVLERAIFRKIGYPFRLNSKAELAQALLSVGVDTGVRTAKGSMKLSEDVLSAVKTSVNIVLPDNSEMKITDAIVERNSLEKQLGSYIKKMTDTPWGRFSYITTRVPTGRLASGDSKNSYYVPLNFQNFTKPHSGMYLATPTEDKGNILGYSFKELNKEEVKEYSLNPENMIVEGASSFMNIRKAVTCPDKEKQYVVSIDFCFDPKTSYVETKEGKKLISSLKDGEEVLTPQGFKRAFNFRPTGKKRKCILKLKDGSQIICSPDHRFKVRQEDGLEVWKELKEISSTDSIIQLD